MIQETSLSCLALPFLLEQLRIEKLYLGHHHPDLAFILFSIGQIYEAYDKLNDAIFKRRFLHLKQTSEERTT